MLRIFMTNILRLNVPNYVWVTLWSTSYDYALSYIKI
jgi:hypothetical protein